MLTEILESFTRVIEHSDLLGSDFLSDDKRVPNPQLLSMISRISESSDVEILIVELLQEQEERPRQGLELVFTDMLRDLIRNTEVRIVLMGEPWVEGLIKSNRQLHSRLKYSICLSEPEQLLA